MPLILSALAIGLLFFFMVVRPQRRNLAKHQAMISDLKVGDNIITSGGLYGSIVSIDDDSVEVNIANNCDVRIAKRAIAMKKVDSKTVSDTEIAESA